MRTGTRYLILTIVTLFALNLPAQQQKWPSTFLWKISGKGLQKDSWLYGTIHLQDKRLFNFGDSLYHALEKAEGFAVEVNIQEFIDSVITRMMLADDEEEDDAPRAVVGTPDTTTMPETNLEADRRIEALKARRQKLVNQLKYGEMPTIMDGYLYGIARRTNKWLGAVEDVNDQLVLFDELSGDIKKEELEATDKELIFSLEKMIATYLAKDLQEIETKYMTGMGKEMQERMLTKRNHKMAASMDSLSRIRSMFFAVGAAHLPGAEGVINLLRKKGFTVTPVFSIKETPAEQYAAKLAVLPWTKVSEVMDSVYTVEMPGAASELNVFGDLVKMKIHYDITTMTMYMTGHSLAQVKEDQLKSLMEDYAKNVKAVGTPYNLKKIQKNGANGLEAFVDAPSAFFRLQFFIKGNVLHMVLAGTEKKLRLMNNDVNRFFQSYTILEGKRPAGISDWQPFSIEGKGFTVSMPGKPKKNRNLENAGTQGGWVSSVYDLLDTKKGLYFLVQVRDLGPGFHLVGDKDWFDSFRENISMMEEKELDSIDTWNGFPRLKLYGESGEKDAYIRAHVMIRGSRIYTIMVIAQDQHTGQIEQQQFFNSFAFQEFPKGVLRTESSPDKSFSSSSVGPIIFQPEEKGDDEAVEEETSVTYVAYDPGDAISMVITKESLSPYLWYASDSLFFEKHISNYKMWSDSLIESRVTTNGKLPSREYLFKMQENHNYKKLRLVLNGDTLYTMYAFAPEAFFKQKKFTSFFDDFRALKEVSAQTVFTDRSDKLKKGMASLDSASFEKASQAFNDMSFTSKDLAFLHDALTKTYLDDTTEYYGLRHRIISKIEELKDPSSVRFVQEQYKKMPVKPGKERLGMVYLLATSQTRESYDLLREILAKDPPATTKGFYIPYRVTDSIELAESIITDILPLFNNPVWINSMVDISIDLIDSSRLSVDKVRPYKSSILRHADTTVESIRVRMEEEGEDFNGYEYTQLIRLLGSFQEPETRDRLREFLTLDDKQILFETSLALAKNEQSVPDSIWQKLAAGNEYRIDLYEALEKMGRENLFPASFRAQKFFAESYLYNYATDDISPSEMMYIGERKTMFKGRMARFHLFKVVFGEGEDVEKEEYLGIAGPYPVNDKEYKSDHDVTQIYWDEAYNKSKVDEWFRGILKAALNPEE